MTPGTCRWISVEERLPEWSGIFLALRINASSDKNPISLRYDYRWYYLEPDNREPVFPVTHWLEVCPPPAPKKKVKKEAWIDRRKLCLSEDQVRQSNVCGCEDCLSVVVPVKVTYEAEE